MVIFCFKIYYSLFQVLIDSISGSCFHYILPILVGVIGDLVVVVLQLIMF